MNNSSNSSSTVKRQTSNIRIIKKGAVRGKNTKQNISNLAYNSAINLHRISELKQILLSKQKVHEAQIDNFLQEDKVFQLQTLQQLSKSQFSKIYKIRVIQTGKHCALKKVVLDEKYQRRQEIICKKIKSPFVVNYIDIFHRSENGKTQLNILMDLYDWNLKEFMMLNKRTEYTFFKILCYQMARGLSYIHSIGICHRDIRPHNVLVKKNGRVVLCDFGSAKMMRSTQKSLFYMNQRSYRAPELLLGNQDYTNSIDVWALGCVFSQILLKKEIFGGSSTIDTLLNICRILGSKGIKKLPGNQQLIQLMPNLKGITLLEYFKSEGCPLFIDLLSKMLQIKPQKRVKMIEVVAHPFFDELRDQLVYNQIMKEIIDISHFFTFSPSEIKNNEQYRSKLIPVWRRDRQQKRISTLP